MGFGLMFDELTRPLFFVFCAAVAASSWVGGAYSVYRGMRSVPDGQLDVPFFSADPRLISPEGVKWRRRIYACMAYFAMSAAIALLIHRGH
jgi:hypothetical protein